MLIVHAMWFYAPQFLLPLIEHMISSHIFDIFILSMNLSGQVNIGVRVLTRQGQNFNKRVLASIIHEVLTAVVAEYNAGQLLAHREVGFTLCIL
jgi:hypothetical protein